MDERAIFAIEEYIYDLCEPGRYWPKYEFSKRSYEIWAATEILKCIQRQPDRTSIEVVKEFALKMDDFYGIDHDDKHDSFIFLTAHDVATDILDILRAMN